MSFTQSAVQVLAFRLGFRHHCQMLTDCWREPPLHQGQLMSTRRLSRAPAPRLFWVEEHEKLIAADQLMLWGKAGAGSVRLDMLRPGLQRRFWDPTVKKDAGAWSVGSEAGVKLLPEVRAACCQGPAAHDSRLVSPQRHQGAPV